MEVDNSTMTLMDNNNTVIQNQDTLAIEQAYYRIQYLVNTIFLPIVFIFGIFGNILNLIIFTRRKIQHRMSEVEKASMTGLISLAMSDMLFCILGLISHFLDQFTYNTSTNVNVFYTIAFYFSAYEAALLNTFLFTSTWIITVMSVERWAAARFPFVARRLASMRKTVLINIFIYVFSIIFNIPEYLESKVCVIQNGNDTILFKIPGPLYSSGIASSYRIMLALLGTFIPIVLLMFCNVMFLVEIHKSRKAFTCENKNSVGYHSQSNNSKAVVRITIILVAIIISFFALVVPSMILSLCKNYLNKVNDVTYHRYRIAIVIGNLTQGINFAINFLLYCTMSREFRGTLAKLLCRRHSSDQYVHSPSQQASRLIDLTTSRVSRSQRDSTTNKVHFTNFSNEPLVTL